MHAHTRLAQLLARAGSSTEELVQEMLTTGREQSVIVLCPSRQKSAATWQVVSAATAHRLEQIVEIQPYACDCDEAVVRGLPVLRQAGSTSSGRGGRHALVCPIDDGSQRPRGVLLVIRTRAFGEDDVDFYRLAGLNEALVDAVRIAAAADATTGEHGQDPDRRIG